ncbi:3832_t:CDS:1 [Dentiscutata erythropus]|uniref:3832_t:CDS:1 n=1 Tax=Dentiscutata erythropus TaxID=1348616 RepID=A0A9N9N832_9GLOM|nr:3832_t:CDS:1 [Dentiscutata erythropus]
MRGQAIYSIFSLRDQIKSKNDNALIIDISQLLSLFNEIVSSFHKSAKNIIVAIKQHLKRESHLQLKIVFTSFGLLKDYATNGVKIFNKLIWVTSQQMLENSFCQSRLEIYY